MNGHDVKEKIRQTGRKFNEVAEEMGITPQSLQKIFNADDVRTGTLERAAKVLGVPVSYFYGDGNITASGHAVVTDNNNEKRSVLVLAEQLSTKDKQIHTKDQQIDRLLGIIEKLSDDGQ